MKQTNFNSMKLPAVFFDVDDTLITIKSMFDFFEYLSKEKELYNLKVKFDEAFKQARANCRPREELNSMYYQFLTGMEMNELMVIGQAWFEQNVVKKNAFINKTLECLCQHRTKEERIVFVSGSMLPLLKPIANYLGVKDILCVNPVVDEKGILTGEISGIQTIGLGKAKAMEKFALEEKIDLGISYGYGDDISDLKMLSCVGHPVYVGNDITMLDHAKRHNWKIL